MKMSCGLTDALAELELAGPAMMLAAVAMVIRQIAQSNIRPTRPLINVRASAGRGPGN